MKRLSMYLKREKIKVDQIAKQLKVDKRAVYYWLQCKNKPSIEIAIKLEEVTGGFVSVYDWR